MSNSISGTVALAQPVLTPLILTGRAGQRIEKEAVKSVAEQHRDKVRKARHEVELEAIEYARVLQQKLIARALDPATDPKLASDIAFKLLDRGIGRVRDAESDDPAKKQDPEGDLLNFLTAISSVSKAGVGHTPPPAIERDVTDPDQGRYLDVDLDQFKESDDDDRD
ncbi:hypothetical protein [Pseudomonas kurunegalensis]|uniref:hypothetical protein n=1 Tax=Pseudomonas kurunegalensis TaxID=485880 RepID=UPI0023641D7F|nr:hypothetical protein [Pseudomonas kurunegalensis]MDD2135659.1 hypothetical protein [Pseudomonas kurunegalensis]